MKLNGKVGMLACIAAMGMFAAIGCESEKKAGTNMGAVSGEKASCTEKSSCTDKAATCTEKKADGSMGAVSEKKTGCCKSAAPQN